MKQINAITQDRISFLLFPDNSPHVAIKDVADGEEVEVVIRLASSLDVMHLLLISDALDTIGAVKVSLVISYLMGARYDRVMHFGDSLDLRVVANLVNSCRFRRVSVFDPHSETALALIKRSHAIDSRPLVESYELDNAMAHLSGRRSGEEG
jgi:ribose-phosphate pyrophosphokinase